MFAALFLLLLGLFSVAGGVLNWEWYFQNYKAKLVVSILGRTGARAFYILLGAFLMACGIGMGWSRLTTPTLTVTEPMLRTLTHPGDISLLEPGATEKLRAASMLQDLQVSKTGQWESFSVIWSLRNPLSPLLFSTNLPHVDIDPGMAMETEVDGQSVRGTLFYFDQNLNPCGHWLTSKHGLDTAEFAVVVLDQASTRKVTSTIGLQVIWLHRTSPRYREYAAF